MRTLITSGVALLVLSATGTAANWKTRVTGRTAPHSKRRSPNWRDRRATA
jgi:hypothetical protein